MNKEQRENLTNIIKEKCYIKSSDLEIDKKMENLIDDSIIKIANLIGMKEKDFNSFDFSKPGLERDLLKNYCFYAWNDNEQEFKHNYADDIMVLRVKYETKYEGAYEEKEN